MILNNNVVLLKMQMMVLFWMSYKDFITYYLVIGICHLYSDYVYSYMHVPKAKTNKGAVISRIEVINKNTHAYIQLHQKIKELN